jgi:hypothetical protein
MAGLVVGDYGCVWLMGLSDAVAILLIGVFGFNEICPRLIA